MKRAKSDLIVAYERLVKSQDQDVIEYALVGFMVALGASSAVASIAIRINMFLVSLTGRFPF
jgi:hypothetical protein